jgi:peroxiredoxin
MNTKGLLSTALLVALGIAVWSLLPAPEPMPDTRFNLLDGRQFDSADLRGRPLLVNFWSVTCGICIRDMPALTRLQESLAERGLLVIGVALASDPPPAIIDFVEQRAPGYAIALDVHGEISKAFGDIRATPTTFLIDPSGRIRYTEQGPLDETRIRATLSTFGG